MIAWLVKKFFSLTHFVDTHGSLVFRGVYFDDLKLTRGRFGFRVDGLLQDERMSPVQPLAINVVYEKHARGRRKKKPHRWALRGEGFRIPPM